MTHAPIVLFVYKRPDHTRQTVEALLRNTGAHDSDLIVFSDGARDAESADAVNEVRRYVHTVSGFRSKRVVMRDRNWGLARSIIAGVSEVLQERGRAVVMEDDIVTSRFFLRFLNDALDVYEHRPIVMSTSGLNVPMRVPFFYRKDVYLSRRSSSWGWATWADRWARVDWDMKDFTRFAGDSTAQARFNQGGNDLSDLLKLHMEGRIDSWAIRWAYSHFRQGAYCLMPVKSMVRNIGCDGTGTHCVPTHGYDVALEESANPYRIRLAPTIRPNRAMLRRVREFQNNVVGDGAMLASYQGRVS